PEHFMKFFLHNKFYATIQGYQSYSGCDFQVTLCTFAHFPKSSLKFHPAGAPEMLIGRVIRGLRYRRTVAPLLPCQ
ncbi:MAG: hypothetical protein QNJ04_15805, partial [Desulfobacterales bacterium]|nr:hypothetical protein [Desulfobacterales bacterium]